MQYVSSAKVEGDVNSRRKRWEAIYWRRSKILEMSSHGDSQAEIARTLQIGESTVSRDLLYLQKQAKENIRKYIDEKLPAEYEKCLIGLTSILREAWITAAKTEDKREKLQALSLAKECYAMKLDLLTNATVVDDAIRFVSSSSVRNKEKAKANDLVIENQDNSSDIQGSEEENQQQWRAGTAAAATTNQTF